MKLQWDIDVSQPTAWFMLHRIRQAWAHDGGGPFNGPVEVDESYFGGRQANMPKAKREALPGGGTGHMTAVADVKDRDGNRIRAEVVADTTKPTLQGFVRKHVGTGATVYSDEHRSSVGLDADFDHGTVNHGAGEYVDGMIHTNGMESFWSMLKRAQKGALHKISPKHLHRYVDEFVGRHNIREEDTLVQMRDTVVRLIGRRLLHRDLIAPNGFSSGSGFGT